MGDHTFIRRNGNRSVFGKEAGYSQSPDCALSQKTTVIIVLRRDIMGKQFYKRLSAAVTSLFVTAAQLTAFPGAVNTITANAAESGRNAAAAIGINTDAPPEGFDEDDNLKNPYGRKTVTFNNAQEVLLGVRVSKGRYESQYNNLIYGDGLSDVTSDGWLYTDESYWATEGTVYEDNVVMDKVKGHNVTAGGNFDGNTDGKINQYAFVGASGYTAYFGVCDPKLEHESTIRTFKLVSDKENTISEKMSGSSVNLDAVINGQLSIVTGDFDGNGRD